jgi:hypothetical protein
MASNIDISGIIGILESIERRGHSRPQVFRDWLNLIRSVHYGD